MRLHRLRVVDFAAIQNAELEFGPGLNVLYGPNDLGKSTLADAIRLALLLPHTSTHIEEYVPWTGGQNPLIEITFETEPQRIWRVRKEFRKGGMALLRESKNGVDFDDVERGRAVDGRLRDLLQWGIPEPGGAGGNRGLPSSFLATALLSTQSDVTAILNDSLQRDSNSTGKDRIAAVLQAVAQDPRFTALLRATQERHDEAYTDRGARKTAQGTVFRVAADRVNRARDEKESFQRAVDDSEGIEQQLNELTGKRGQREEAVAAATERLTTLELLAAQAADLRVAEQEIGAARQEVSRIQTIGADVAAAERSVEELARKREAAEQALSTAQAQQAEAEAALQSAEEVARAASDPAVTDIVARQRLELRKTVAEQASQEAQQQIDGTTSAQRLVDAVAAAEREHRTRQTEADNASAALTDAAAKARSAEGKLCRVELLERALEARAADQGAALAQADMDRHAVLQARYATSITEREAVQNRRAAITVPPADALGPMRRLANDLAGARGALNVGLIVTVTPSHPIDIRVKKDGTDLDPALTGKALEVEANAELDIDIDDVAAVRIRGGRREAQQRAVSLEDRWSREVAPHLVAANVTDLEGLSAKIAEAQTLDTSVEAKVAELQSLQVQIDALASSTQKLHEALERRKACHAALGGVPLETLASELASLGADPTAALRRRRQQSSSDLGLARATANQADTAQALAQERTRNSESVLNAAMAARDGALLAYPQGLAASLAAAQAALAAATGEQRKVMAEFALLESTIAAQNAQVEVAVRQAHAEAEQSRTQLDAAHTELTLAITDQASQVGRWEQLRELRDAQDLAAAEHQLQAASDQHAALPVPAQIVTEAEVTAARNAKTTAESDLAAIQREIDQTHGALRQVGGAVARERLRDAIEGFELAERQEREVEADYEAWRLLLVQMKEADAAQASNLGEALAPAIAGQFEALTQRRYEELRLTAQLGTEGVVIAGAVRSTESISVGTREQLSTLYRLSLAEYLCTTVVLDDQLVQSDDTRMDWFRALLAEKAHSFQIVVFTCRPGNYLAASERVPKGKGVYRDTDGGFVRAVDLGRAVRRR